ncbi:universal stress protein [Roseobacteraceae bacterium S113]
MKRFKNILVVCDEGSSYEHAFARVRWLAKSNDAKVTLLDVMTPSGDLARLLRAVGGAPSAELDASMATVHMNRLEELATSLRAAGIDVTTRVLSGALFMEVIREVQRRDHDLVIKGAQRSPGAPYLRGPDMHLMRKCPCPVWVLNSAVEPKAQRILAAVDVSSDDETRGALATMVMQLATSLSVHDEARLDVMHVWRLDEEATLRHSLAKVPSEDVDRMVSQVRDESREGLDGLMAGFTEFADRTRVLHINGLAEDVISEHVAAEGIDTIVMGSVGRTGLAGFFIGNTAETVLSRVKCSVLTVKPDGFVSPVSPDGDT